MDISPIMVAMFATALIAIAVGLVLSSRERVGVWAVVVSFVGWSLLAVAFVMQAGVTQEAQKKDYDSSVTKTIEYLNRDGFQVVSGALNLTPETKSKLVLSYEGQNYDCTLYSPRHSNQKLWFSCGEDRLDLEQIKESK